jgi:hypothetical protein
MIFQVSTVNFLRNIQIDLFRNRQGQGRGQGENDGLTMLLAAQQARTNSIDLRPHSCLASRACARSTPLTGTWFLNFINFDRDVNFFF